MIYTGLDAEGQVMFDCPVHIPGPVMMHDMQITADYAIIMDTCMEFKPQVGRVAGAGHDPGNRGQG